MDELSYHRMGPETGEAVVLLHGFGADRKGWTFTQAALAKERGVYAVDLPGHGESAKDVGVADLSFFAGAVGSLVDGFPVSRVHVVGHSFGGAVAIRFAAERLERVASLSLIAPVGLGREINFSFLDGFLRSTSREGMRSVLEHLVANRALIGEQLVDDVLGFKRVDGVEASLRKILARNFTDGQQAIDLREDLARFSFPVAVIWGLKDRVIPPDHIQGLPDSVSLTLVADAGHLPHLESSKVVAEAIRTNISFG